MSQRPALGVPNIYPFRALVFFPNIFQFEDSYNFFPWGGTGPRIMHLKPVPCFSFLPPFTRGPPRRLLTAG